MKVPKITEMGSVFSEFLIQDKIYKGRVKSWPGFSDETFSVGITEIRSMFVNKLML